MVDDVRRRLAERARARRSRGWPSLTADHDAVVAASLDTNADDEHDPEGATIAFERSQIGSLVRQVRHHVSEVDAALERVDAGHLRRVRALRRTDRRGPARRAPGRAALHPVRGGRVRRPSTSTPAG